MSPAAVFALIVLGGCIAGLALVALDRRPMRVRRQDWDEKTWWELWS